MIAFQFRPDVIFEITGYCDRSCKGCYAPNIVTTNSMALVNSNFLSIENLVHVLPQIHAFEHESASIRGGEPSLHPELPAILKLLSQSFEKLFLETHGRWILKNSTSCLAILEACRDHNVIVKISFDKMHNTTPELLLKIISVLQEFSVNFQIAITEENEEKFLKQYEEISFVPKEKVIFQALAKKATELIKPKIGVVNVRGELKESLQTKWVMEGSKQ